LKEDLTYFVSLFNPMPLIEYTWEKARYGVTSIIDWFAANPFPVLFWPPELAADDRVAEDIICLVSHKKARPSTWDKHTKRRPGDKEKADDYRRRPRKRPPGYPKKGPWPPKTN